MPSSGTMAGLVPGLVAGGDRSRYRGLAEVHVCFATRRSSLSLAVAARKGPALVDTSKTVEGGTST
jgi:hypothetical protein